MNAVMKPPFQRTVLNPSQLKQALGTTEECWAYVYKHPTFPWTLAIATKAEPGSEKLSLGGFRIVPKDRANLEGFDPVKEAVNLAVGMDEKVYWSKLMKMAGPLGLPELERVVGGKCVLLPGNNSRVGEIQDFELLDFATTCLKDAEENGGFHIVTGQDLGHGKMSDGKTASLSYLHSRFDGSVMEDTSQPTGEGNYFCLKGMLAGFDLELEQTTIGYIGCGNVGSRVFSRAHDMGAKALVIEPSEHRQRQLKDSGATVWAKEEKLKLCGADINALCVNANGGSLDDATLDVISKNKKLNLVCGSENLAMPNPSGEARLLEARKLITPTELCGMMGYLTAVEEFLLAKNGQKLDVDTLLDAAKKLEEPSKEAVRYCRKQDFRISFAQAIREIFSA